MAKGSKTPLNFENFQKVVVNLKNELKEEITTEMRDGFAKVNQRLGHLETGSFNLETRLSSLETELKTTKNELRSDIQHVASKLDHLEKQVTHITLKQHGPKLEDHEDRIKKLEVTVFPS